MAETEAQAARKNRPGNARVGRPFEKGNPGRPKGIVNERARIGQEAARALEEKAWDVAEGLLRSSSWRAREAGMKVVLGYAIGLPRATLELTGGFGDLSRELTAALQEARLRRAALDSALPVAPLEAAPPALPALPAADAPALEVEVKASITSSYGKQDPPPVEGSEAPE